MIYIRSVKGGPGKIEMSYTVSGLPSLPPNYRKYVIIWYSRSMGRYKKKSENIWLMGLSCLFE